MPSCIQSISPCSCLVVCLERGYRAMALKQHESCKKCKEKSFYVCWEIKISEIFSFKNHVKKGSLRLLGNQTEQNSLFQKLITKIKRLHFFKMHRYQSRKLFPHTPLPISSPSLLRASCVSPHVHCAVPILRVYQSGYACGLLHTNAFCNLFTTI